MNQTFHKSLYCVKSRARHCMFVIHIFQALRAGQGILYMFGGKLMLGSRTIVEVRCQRDLKSDTSSVTASFRVTLPFGA